MNFDEMLVHLRAGKKVKQKIWHKNAYIYKDGNDIYYEDGYKDGYLKKYVPVY